MTRALLTAGFATLTGAAGWLSAQTQNQPRPFASPMVVSGNDFGFRVEGQNGDTVIGKLVVRVNGQWVEARFQPGVVRADTR